MSSPHEWIRLAVTPAMRDRARARRIANDAGAGLPGIERRAGTVADTELGYVAEEAIAERLELLGHDVVVHGGYDELADLEVDGRGVSVRYCGARVPWRTTHYVYAFDHHLGRHHDVAFVGPIAGEADVLLLGFADTAELARGRAVARGAELVTGFRAVHDLHALQVEQLTSPAVWRFRLVAAA